MLGDTLLWLGTELTKYTKSHESKIVTYLAHSSVQFHKIENYDNKLSSFCFITI